MGNLVARVDGVKVGESESESVVYMSVQQRPAAGTGDEKVVVVERTVPTRVGGK